jgi:hypothetical protein
MPGATAIPVWGGTLRPSLGNRRGLGAPFFVGKPRMLRHPLANKDVEEGLRVGVPVILTFFINGWLLMGAQPLQSFVPISRACCSHALASRIWQRCKCALRPSGLAPRGGQSITARL